MVRIGSLIPYSIPVVTHQNCDWIKRPRCSTANDIFPELCIYIVVDRERERERRQPQLKIIYFEAHYPSSLFKTMTCQTVRHHRWIYVCRSKNRRKIEDDSFYKSRKKRDWLNSAYLIRFCPYLSFFFFLVYIYINIDFLLFHPY
jgi:hypothetical protein